MGDFGKMEIPIGDISSNFVQFHQILFNLINFLKFSPISSHSQTFPFHEVIVKKQVEQSKQDAVKDNVVVPKTQEEYCINSRKKQNAAASRSQSIQSSSALYEMDDMFDDEYYESYSEDESSHDK